MDSFKQTSWSHFHLLCQLILDDCGFSLFQQRRRHLVIQSGSTVSIAVATNVRLFRKECEPCVVWPKQSPCRRSICNEKVAALNLCRHRYTYLCILCVIICPYCNAREEQTGQKQLQNSTRKLEVVAWRYHKENQLSQTPAAAESSVRTCALLQ